MSGKTKIKPMTNLGILRLCGFAACETFCLFSIVFSAVQSEWTKMIMAIASIFFVFVPEIVQRLFRFRIQTPLYFLVLLYTICPLLGFNYGFYYKFGWWDDLLHGFAGLVFAMFGAYLPKIINKKAPCSVLLCALFGFVFSMAVSAVWEFIEFGIDTFFGMDMQKDTWLATIRNSHLLSQYFHYENGQLAEITFDGIIVEGEVIRSYLDIGLIDTMTDMLVETAGALVYSVVYLITKGKHFAFEPLPPKLSDETDKAEETQEIKTKQTKN
ncbi:MAG: hypothetical protein IKA20_04260 [Clostridia bacterium]|nr:hypothetical protein [Clostridia bacterium]